VIASQAFSSKFKGYVGYYLIPDTAALFLSGTYDKKKLLFFFSPV